MHHRKDFENGCSIWLNNDASIHISHGNIDLWFFPFPINDNQTYKDEEMRCYYQDNESNYPLGSFEFTLQDEKHWDLTITTFAMSARLRDVPIELEQELINLCNEYHNNHSINPTVKKWNSTFKIP